MSIKCECRCGSDLFQVFIIHQVNGNDDTYEVVCKDCGKEYAIASMVIQSDDDDISTD